MPPKKAPPPPPGKTAPRKAPGPPPPPSSKKSVSVAAAGGRSLKRRSSMLGRKLHWEGFGEAKISGTIFQDLVVENEFTDQFSSMVDATALKSIFSKAKEAADGARSTRRRSTITARTDEVTVLSNSRAQNIAIVLSRLKYSMEELTNVFMKLETTLSLDVLETVAGILPTPDELQDFKKFEASGKDPTKLRRIEKDYVPLTQITRASQRVTCLTAVAKLPEVESDLTRSCDVLDEAQTSVRQSKRFRGFLSAVLVWGNFVNHGGDEEEAPPPAKEEEENRTDSTAGRRLRRSGTVKVQMQTYGFTLGSLMKLYDFKTTVDPTISSLHFIIANMVESSPNSDLLNMADDFNAVTAASKISAKSLKEKLAGISTDCKFLKSEVDLPTAKTVYGDAYDNLVEMHGKVEECSARLAARYEEVVQRVIDTGSYFGDKKIKKENYDEFFITLLQFLGVYKKCCADITKNPKKYKSVLVQSAQNRGLMYVNEQQGGAVAVPGGKAATKKDSKFSKPTGAPMKKGGAKKMGGIAAAATGTGTSAVELGGDHHDDAIAAEDAEAALAAIQSGAVMLKGNPSRTLATKTDASSKKVAESSKKVAENPKVIAAEEGGEVSAVDELAQRRAAFRRAGGRRSTVNIPGGGFAPPPPRIQKPKAVRSAASGTPPTPASSGRGPPAFTRKATGPVVVPPRRPDTTQAAPPLQVAAVSRGGRHSTGKRRGTLYSMAVTKAVDDPQGTAPPSVADSKLLNSGAADRDRLGVSDSEMDERAHRSYIVDKKHDRVSERTSDPETTTMEVMRRFPARPAPAKGLADFWTFSESMEDRCDKAAEAYLLRQQSTFGVLREGVDITGGVEAYIGCDDDWAS